MSDETTTEPAAPADDDRPAEASTSDEGERALRDDLERLGALVESLTADLSQLREVRQAVHDAADVTTRGRVATERELQEARSRIETLTATAEQHNARAEDLSRRAGELSLRVDELTRDMEGHSAEREQLETQVASMRRRLEEQEEHQRAAEASTTEALARADQERAHAEELTQQLEELRTRREEATRQADEARGEVDSLRRELEESTRRAQEQETGAEDLRSRVEAAEEAARQAEERALAAEREKAEELNAVRADTEQARRSLDEIEADRARLTEALAEERGKAEAAALEARRLEESKGTESQRIGAELEAARTRIADLEHRVAEAENAKSTASDRAELAGAERTAMQARIDELILAQEDLNRKLLDKEARIRDLLAQHEEATRQADGVEELSRARTEVEQERDGLVAQLQEQLAGTQRLESEVTRLTATLEEARQRAEEHSRALSEREQALASAPRTEEIEDLRRQLAERDDQLAALEADRAGANEGGGGAADEELLQQIADLETRLEQSEIRARHAYSTAENAEAELRIARERGEFVVVDSSSEVARERDELRRQLEETKRRLQEAEKGGSAPTPSPATKSAVSEW